MFLFLMPYYYQEVCQTHQNWEKYFNLFLLWHIPFYKVLICTILSLRYFFILFWLIGCSLLFICLACYRCYSWAVVSRYLWYSAGS